MADSKKRKELGDKVTVITKGRFQLVDVARDLVIPPLREVTLQVNPFILDQLDNGNLVEAGSEGAPEAQGDPLKEEDLYEPLAQGRLDMQELTDSPDTGPVPADDTTPAPTPTPSPEPAPADDTTPKAPRRSR